MANQVAVLLLPLAFATACSSDDSADRRDDSERAYVVGSVVSGPEGDTAYVNIVGSLDAQELDYTTAYEFPGWADVWAWNGKVFVADGETPIVRRYAVDANRALVAEGEISFAAYGVAETAFWNVIWVSADKAYMANGQGEYVVWNPTTMAITGTMAHPPLEPRGAQRVRSASADRGVVVRGNRLYHPYYWADDTWTSYATESRIAIYDTDQDRLIGVVDAPCPGLDIATQDDAGNLYFSNWTGNVGLTLVSGAAAPCGVKIAASSDALDPAWTTSWTAITDGRQASALRYSADGRALLSVFHQERIEFDAKTDPWALVGSENWRIWSVDLQTRAAAPIESIAWNSGATYFQRIDGKSFLLVPAADYATSAVYAVDGASAEPRFTTNGWGLRLFKVR